MSTSVSEVHNQQKNANDPFPLRAFFGHHKCATGWIDSILMEVCFHLGRKFQIVHRLRDTHRHDTIQEVVDDLGVEFLAYTNAKIEQVDGLTFNRAFHVVRDPRDILVSAYFSHLRTHPTDNWPELAEHRKRLQEASKDEGLFLEMDFSEKQFRDMAAWDYNDPRILELKMENLTADPATGFVEVFDHLEMLDEVDTQGMQRLIKRATLNANRVLYKTRRFVPTSEAPKVKSWSSIPREKIDRIIEAKSFSNLSGGRKRGEENRQSHYRKGVPGDWANHFSDEHRSAFKERFNDVLVTLDYEDDDSW